jgi:hypothetical protein
MSDALEDQGVWNNLKFGFLAPSGPYGQVLEGTTEEQKAEIGKASASLFADFTPIIGEVKSAKEGMQDFEEGNYAMAALGGLGAIPLAGPVFRGAKSLAKGADKLSGGMLTSGKNIINDTAFNMPTNVRGGVIGDALDKMPSVQKAMGIATDKKIPTASGKVKGAGLPYYTQGLTPLSVGGEAATSMFNTLRSKLNPKDVAFERVTGLTYPKAKEISQGAEGAAETAELMGRQMGKDTSLLAPMSKKTYLAEGIDASNTNDIANAVGNKFVRANTPNPVPDKVSKRFARHIQAQVKSKGTVSIKNPARVGSQEASGQSKVGANIIKSLQGNARKMYLNALKTDSMSPKQTVEFLQVSGAIDVSTFRKYFKKDFETPTQAIGVLLRARHKESLGKTLGAGEKKAITAFNKIPVKKSTGMRVAAVKDDAGNVLSNDTISKIKQVPKDNFLTTQQAYRSSQKELGGANAFISVDPVKQRAYVGISDKHDIGGMNPVGGDNIITAQPIVSVDYVKGTYGKKAGLADSTKYKGNKADIQKANKNVEGMLSVNKRPSETGRQFVKRSINEADIRVTKEDQRKVAQRAAKLGGAGLLTGGAGSKVLSDDD